MKKAAAHVKVAAAQQGETIQEVVTHFLYVGIRCTCDHAST